MVNYIPLRVVINLFSDLNEEMEMKDRIAAVFLLFKKGTSEIESLRKVICEF